MRWEIIELMIFGGDALAGLIVVAAVVFASVISR
jgi:hypothetical protein